VDNRGYGGQVQRRPLVLLVEERNTKRVRVMPLRYCNVAEAWDTRWVHQCTMAGASQAPLATGRVAMMHSPHMLARL